ncbi:hypothetical protein [Cochlodiniinecator piscidefendens]|uniref:hypothetical protein n=1 Tax=Cochlodiniinecator piscidefendens TaxID=2715756 RepID=UPI00140E6BF0|nr:hypothetical protein [Cochlodiniinecator piscidefendens]
MSAKNNTDNLEQYLICLLLGERFNPKQAIVKVVEEFPCATGLEIVFSLVSIASNMCQWMPKDKFEETLPSNIYVAAAMLSADLYALEQLGRSRVCAKEICEFWASDEPFFVNTVGDELEE